MLRQLYRYATADGIISRDLDPFRDFMVRPERTEKTRLTFSEIDRLVRLELHPRTALWHTRNYFMFSFYSGGMRFSDVCTLRWRNIVDGRLIYRMGKTGVGKNIKLVPQADRIIDFYRTEESAPVEFVFPLLPPDLDYSNDRLLKRQISSKNVIVNKNLKKLATLAGITDNISFHVSRHSWADFARRKGMSVYTISKILAHSSLKVTEGYLKGFDSESIDAEFDKLFAEDPGE
jgi:integrase